MMELIERQHQLAVVLPSLAIAIFVYAAYKYVAKRNKGPLPPGPPKHWFPGIGNTHQILAAPVFPCLLADWAKEYGEIYSFSVLGHTTIVVNSAKAARELFDLKSTIYSSRTHQPLLRDFLCKRSNIAFEPYGDSWRRHRKAVHRELNINQFKQYNYIQEREAWILAQGFLDHPEPEKLLMLLQRFGGSIGLGALYDHRVKSYQDPIIVESSWILERKLALLQPGASFYDFIPFAEYIPDFLMPSKALARAARDRGEKLDAELSKMVQDRLAGGEDTSSFHAGILQREKESGPELSPFERDSLSSTLVGAAVDTTTASMHVLILAYIIFPDVQQKLREEVDHVVGRDRAPTIEDLPNLPYTRAFVREALRWRSVTPFSLPHATSEEDWYQGYYIPKNVTVIGNSVAMEHDESMFPDHDTVKPERFLDPTTGDVNETPIFSFGFGRRICPGMNMATSSLALGSACLIWGFSFEKQKDAQGNIMEPDIRPENCHDGGNVFRPNPFPFAVRPRAKNVDAIIRQAAASAL